MSTAANAERITENLNDAHKALHEARESLRAAREFMLQEKSEGREKAAELDGIEGALKLATAALGTKYWQWEGYTTARMEAK